MLKGNAYCPKCLRRYWCAIVAGQSCPNPDCNHHPLEPNGYMADIHQPR